MSAAKTEAESKRQSETLDSQSSSLQPSSPHPTTTSRSVTINWACLIRRYQQHKPRMALLLKTVKGPPAARDAIQLLKAQADLWGQRPGFRTRRLQIQYTDALLRWAVRQKLL